MKVSVLLCSYNGAQYVIQQLDSLKNQTRVPDEVIIKDDQSTDDTVTLCQKYIARNKLNWKVIVNKNNLGWKKNFYYGILCCTGDIVFLCDQDDIWKSTKIEEMEKIMTEDPTIELLVSNYDVMVDNHDNDKYVAQSSKMNDTGKVKKIGFSQKWPYITRPGCTYCLKKVFFDEIKGIWKPEWPHDANLYRFAVLRDTLWLYEKKTIFFRRHGGNQTGSQINSREQRTRDVQYYIDVVNYFIHYLEQNEKFGEVGYKRDILTYTLNWLKLREDALNTQNFIKTLSLCRYLAYYAGIKSWIADLLCILAK